MCSDVVVAQTANMEIHTTKHDWAVLLPWCTQYEINKDESTEQRARKVVQGQGIQQTLLYDTNIGHQEITQSENKQGRIYIGYMDGHSIYGLVDEEEAHGVLYCQQRIRLATEKKEKISWGFRAPERIQHDVKSCRADRCVETKGRHTDPTLSRKRACTHFGVRHSLLRRSELPRRRPEGGASRRSQRDVAAVLRRSGGRLRCGLKAAQASKQAVILPPCWPGRGLEGVAQRSEVRG